MHIEDLLIIWSKLWPKCNYLNLLELVCHLAEFRVRGINTACQSDMTCKSHISPSLKRLWTWYYKVVFKLNKVRKTFRCS